MAASKKTAKAKGAAEPAAHSGGASETSTHAAGSTGETASGETDATPAGRDTQALAAAVGAAVRDAVRESHEADVARANNKYEQRFQALLELVRRRNAGETLSDADIQTAKPAVEDGLLAIAVRAFHERKGTPEENAPITLGEALQRFSYTSDMVVVLARRPAGWDGHSRTSRDVPGVVFGGQKHPRVGAQDYVFERSMLGRMHGTSRSDYWRETFLFAAAASLLDAAIEFDAVGELADYSGSTLHLMGETLAREFRRNVLRTELVRTRWNLAHVAERLRFKSSSKVLEAIRAVGLEAEYEEMKRSGVAAGKGHRPRTKLTDPEGDAR